MPKSEIKKRSHGLKIRPMEVDDLAPVFHLGEKLFTANTVPNLYRTWDEFEVVGLYQSDSEYCFVAEIEDHLVGFVLGTVISKTKSAWKYGHLIWMGVDPAFSRQGIADRLAKYFLQTTLEEGVRMLIVDTEADNLPALAFFRKMGFGNPEEHIYLTMNLSSRQQVALEKKANGQAKKKDHD
jgi:ribosomal protein S18 acetylase RimI-like enzyme